MGITKQGGRYCSVESVECIIHKAGDLKSICLNAQSPYSKLTMATQGCI